MEIYKGYNWKDLENSKPEKLSAIEEDWEGVRVFKVQSQAEATGQKNLALNYLSFWREGNKLAKKIGRPKP